MIPARAFQATNFLMCLNLFRLRHIHGFFIDLKALALVLLFGAFLTQPVLGQESPPVGIGGFHYRYVPENRVHMNFCREKPCVPGSKVSYILYPPEDNRDFDE